jgi:hypothetical protein
LIKNNYQELEKRVNTQNPYGGGQSYLHDSLSISVKTIKSSLNDQNNLKIDEILPRNKTSSNPEKRHHVSYCMTPGQLSACSP